jgi:glycosyltransferase involved in cell wall biosynthesis
MTRVVLANKHFLGLAGGAERNICDLANWLAANGHDVTIVSETKHGTSAAFFLDEKVTVATPDTTGDVENGDKIAQRFADRPDAHSWLKSTFKMRKRWAACIRAINPDVILTFMPHTSTMLLQELGDSFPILVTNQNDPQIDYFSNKHGDDEFELHLRLESLSLAAAVHFLIPNFLDSMPQAVAAKSIVIPNVVPAPFSKDKTRSTAQKRIVAVGRLVQQKGFDALITAFGLSILENDGWQLVIYGNGPEEKSLRAQIRRLKLQRNVYIMGFTRFPLRAMEAADIFVIPSLYEGWGLTLTEAMSLGMPTIGFRDCPGVNWLIDDGTNGVLVERSPNRLAEAMYSLAHDATRRARLGAAARNSVRRFAPELVYPMWDKAIFALVHEA